MVPTLTVSLRVSSFKQLASSSGLRASSALAFRSFSSACVNLPRDDDTKSTTQSTMINFAKGHPNRKLLPMQEMQEIFAKVALKSNEETLQDSLNYPKADPGDPQFLAELGAFVDRHTKHDDLGSNYDNSPSSSKAKSRTNHVFATTGVSHGLEMLCSTQTKPGDVVLMENPTYFLAAGVFRSHDLQVKSLPMKRGAPGGVDMDQLELSLESGKLQPPRMIYVIPTHQNPTARVLPIEDRWRLAKLARKYGILVVGDEVYHLLDWRDVDRDGPRPARMAVVGSKLYEQEEEATITSGRSSRMGCCVTVSSFTKIFAPGVRCGWVEGPEFIIKSLENLGYIQSQGGCTPLIGELMRTSLMEGIGDRVLAKLNAAFQERSNLLCRILSADKGIHFDTKPLGGYFVWVSFDGIDDTGSFLSFCSERGVRFLPGERCDVGSDDDRDGGDCRRWARFCFADLDLDDLEKGAALVVQCYREYLRELPPK
jgi:2-aminoadipate transaminase